MANTILEKLQEKYPVVADDARNIAEAFGMINGTGGRGSGNIADVMNAYITITFDPNGGVGESFSKRYAANGKGSVLPQCPFNPPEGKEFDYWYRNASGTTSEEIKEAWRPGFYPNGSYNADGTFYAIWKDEELGQS